VAARVRPDVVVMDLEMGRGDGVAATRVLAEQVPETRVLVLTVHTDREQLLPLLQAGAPRRSAGRARRKRGAEHPGALRRAQ
jgi:two-component system, NarL family, nitrate/nitrite response regulator NarL